jgi:hypothetical protein
MATCEMFEGGKDLSGKEVPPWRTVQREVMQLHVCSARTGTYSGLRRARAGEGRGAASCERHGMQVDRRVQRVHASSRVWRLRTERRSIPSPLITCSGSVSVPLPAVRLSSR